MTQFEFGALCTAAIAGQALGGMAWCWAVTHHPGKAAAGFFLLIAAFKVTVWGWGSAWW